MKTKSVAIAMLAFVLSILILCIAAFHRNSAAQVGAGADVSEETSHAHEFRSILVPPTCTENGYTKYLCACGYNYVDDETPASGHTYAMESLTSAAETTRGKGIMTCQTCGETETVELMEQP